MARDAIEVSLLLEVLLTAKTIYIHIFYSPQSISLGQNKKKKLKKQA